MDDGSQPYRGDLYRIDAPERPDVGKRGFCAGFLVEHGRVTRTAPILGWARGKSIESMQFYCQRNGWMLEGPLSGADGEIER